MNLKIIVSSLTAAILLLGGYLMGQEYFRPKQEPTGKTITEKLCAESGGIYKVCAPCPKGTKGVCSPCPSSCACSEGKFWKDGEGCIAKIEISDISTWKTYRNEKYGFEVKYPENWKIVTGIYDSDPVIGKESNFFIGASPRLNGVDFNLATIGDSATFANYALLKGVKNIEEVDHDSVYVQGHLSRAFIGEFKINNKRGLEFEIYGTKSVAQLVIFQNGNNFYEVLNHEISKELFNQILSTFKFIEPTGGSGENIKTTGVAFGKISIGPLCPVEPCINPANPYAGKKLVFTERVGGKMFYADISPEGVYWTDLPAGDYFVTLSDCQYMGCSRALPRTIRVDAEGSTKLDIDIDTGIR